MRHACRKTLGQGYVRVAFLNCGSPRRNLYSAALCVMRLSCNSTLILTSEFSSWRLSASAFCPGKRGHDPTLAAHLQLAPR